MRTFVTPFYYLRFRFHMAKSSDSTTLILAFSCLRNFTENDHNQQVVLWGPAICFQSWHMQTGKPERKWCTIFMFKQAVRRPSVSSFVLMKTEKISDIFCDLSFTCPVLSPFTPEKYKAQMPRRVFTQEINISGSSLCM
jgi:hypothetical protein